MYASLNSDRGLPGGARVYCHVGSRVAHAGHKPDKDGLLASPPRSAVAGVCHRAWRCSLLTDEEIITQRHQVTALGMSKPRFV